MKEKSGKNWWRKQDKNWWNLDYTRPLFSLTRFPVSCTCRRWPGTLRPCESTLRPLSRIQDQDCTVLASVLVAPCASCLLSPPLLYRAEDSRWRSRPQRPDLMCQCATLNWERESEQGWEKFSRAQQPQASTRHPAANRLEEREEGVNSVKGFHSTILESRVSIR